jgi:hypothetical protein
MSISSELLRAKVGDALTMILVPPGKELNVKSRHKRRPINIPIIEIGIVERQKVRFERGLRSPKGRFKRDRKHRPFFDESPTFSPPSHTELDNGGVAIDCGQGQSKQGCIFFQDGACHANNPQAGVEIKIFDGKTGKQIVEIPNPSINTRLTAAVAAGLAPERCGVPPYGPIEG